jgi:hypothetical protein
VEAREESAAASGFVLAHLRQLRQQLRQPPSLGKQLPVSGGGELDDAHGLGMRRRRGLAALFDTGSKR